MNPYKITTIKQSPNIDNLESLRGGLGARYLEVFDSHHTPPRPIAVRWRRKPPAKVEPGHYLIDFLPDNV